ncbi:MAG: OmpA family protein [Flavobacteriales bacterium]|nr:OmpA family protein [Flavobacteriales bacterium]
MTHYFRFPIFSRICGILFPLSIMFGTSTIAQNPEGCEMPGNKKVQKLWDQAVDEKKPSVRRELYDQILNEEAGHTGALFGKYYEQLKQAEKNPMGKGIGFGYDPMKQVAEQCPEYHPYPFYYMGKISFEKRDFKEAEQHFKAFLKLELPDPRMYPKDYTEKYTEIEALLPQCAYYDSLYGHPVPFDPKVVPGVSGRDNDYLAILSPDGENALYIRRHQVRRKNDLTPREIEEFTISRRQKDGSFDSGTAMPRPFNLTENLGSASMTIDNKRMFLTICEDLATGYKNCDIYYSDWHPAGWGDPVNLGERVNGKNSFEGQPTVTPDGKTLYFVSIREDEIGDIDNMDLYISHLQEDGSWGEAKNLGTTINTKKNEKSPFIHEDSHTLYFSSDGHKGVGGFDIYYTRHDSLENWLAPRNIGHPINSTADDVGFFASVDGTTAYFSSNEREDGVGGWDLFSFALYKEARPEKVLFVKGKLKDEKNGRVTSGTVQLTNMRSKEVHEVAVDSITGGYVAVMNLDADVMLTVKKDNAAFISRYFSKDDPELGGVVKEDIQVKQLKAGEPYRINDINFAFEKSELNMAGKNILDAFAIYLKDNPNLKVSIHGHTDSDGSATLNMTLSEDRAKAVKDYLVSQGVAAGRLTHKGFGSTKPIADNSSTEGKAKNRRTEFIVEGN